MNNDRGYGNTPLNFVIHGNNPDNILLSGLSLTLPYTYNYSKKEINYCSGGTNSLDGLANLSTGLVLIMYKLVLGFRTQFQGIVPSLRNLQYVSAVSQGSLICVEDGAIRNKMNMVRSSRRGEGWQGVLAASKEPGVGDLCC